MPVRPSLLKAISYLRLSSDKGFWELCS